MTKKVISIIFLIVTSLIFATSVFAELTTYGLPGTQFDLVFNVIDKSYFAISVVDSTGNNPLETDENNEKFLDAEVGKGLAKTQCNIVVETNYNPTIEITFGIFKNKASDDVLTYKVRLYKNKNESTDYFFDYQEISNSAWSYQFSSGASNLATKTKYIYPLGLDIVTNLDDVAVGNYEAEISIKVIST